MASPHRALPELRPRLRQALYQDGMRDVLQRCRFNGTHGWMLAGPPRAAHARVLASMTGGDRRMRSGAELYGHTEAYRRNDWRFFAASSDQGFLFYMMQIRHPGAAYVPFQGGARASLPRAYARHWFGPVCRPGARTPGWQALLSLLSILPVAGPAQFKPHLHHALEAAYQPDRGVSEYESVARAIQGDDPSALATLYDHVLQGEVAQASWSAEHRWCSDKQRLVRRAIEGHAHWREVARVWHAHSWAYRNGHAEYLPSLVGDLGSAPGSVQEWASMPMDRVLQARSGKHT